MTGHRSAYPLLISLANIRKSICMKNSNGSFLLLALLPIAKFINPNRRICSLLHDRLIHTCLDHILLPLKMAAAQGVMLSDPLGFQRLCYTFLASYTVDTPEAQLLACIGAKSSPVTMANSDAFGDGQYHQPRTAHATLELIQSAHMEAISTELIDFLKESQKYHLNGGEFPFWRDWQFAQPCIFLTPEPLHHWHKQFWDHDCKWCIHILSATEMDFQYMIFQPLVGF